MRIFRLFVFVLSIVVGLTAYQPKVRAAEYYDNAQMNYIFSGAKFKIDGLYCTALGGSNKISSAELDITFKTDGTFTVYTKCVHPRQDWIEESSGNWIVENGSVCLNLRGQEIINNVYGTSQICRRAK